MCVGDEKVSGEDQGQCWGLVSGEDSCAGRPARASWPATLRAAALQVARPWVCLRRGRGCVPPGTWCVHAVHMLCIWRACGRGIEGVRYRSRVQHRVLRDDRDTLAHALEADRLQLVPVDDDPAAVRSQPEECEYLHHMVLHMAHHTVTHTMHDTGCIGRGRAPASTCPRPCARPPPRARARAALPRSRRRRAAGRGGRRRRR